MPVFRFSCETCKAETRKITTNSTNEIKCECGETATRQIPESTTSIVMETKDKHRGVQLRKGHKEQLKKRMTEHHNKHELAEKIETHGIEDAKKFGWDTSIKKN